MTKSVAKYIIVGFASLGLLTLIVSSDAKVNSFNHAATADENELEIAVDTPSTPTHLPVSYTHLTLPTKRIV